MKKITSIIKSTEFACLLAALFFITLCSKSSFIYPLNDWGDVNCYFIIGKGMKQGMIPYRDLYDQKGIVIFFLYFIANLITSNSFFGVYVIEVISAFLYLLISLKTVRLFCNPDKYALALASILACTTYASYAFCHGGSAEELMLPAFAYGIYIVARQLQSHDIPDKKLLFLFGLFAGLLFFSKFTLCAFYIPIIIIMMIDASRNKMLAVLMRNSLFFILGTVIIFIPIILYFAINGALGDYYYGYFYNNIFNYHTSNGASMLDFWAYGYLPRCYIFLKKGNILPIILILISTIYLIFRKKYLLFISQFLAFAALFFIQFIYSHPYNYYGLPLFALTSIGLCVLVAIFDKLKFLKPAIISLIAVAGSICIGYIFADNKYFMFVDKNDTQQFIFANEMKEYSTDDRSLLVYYPLDEGFYFANGTMPVTRAFIQTHLKNEILTDEQNEVIHNRKVEFIETQKVLCDSENYEETYAHYKDYINEHGLPEDYYIVTFDDFGYELIDEIEAYYEYDIHTYRLYKKVTN